MNRLQYDSIVQIKKVKCDVSKLLSLEHWPLHTEQSFILHMALVYVQHIQ